MRFIGHSYNESLADPKKCLVQISTGKWSHLSQCARAPMEGKLRCKQHETKDTAIVADDPQVAEAILGTTRFRKLAQRGWLNVRDPHLKLALDRIVELEAQPVSSPESTR